jgi:hypothetical protein
MERVARLRDEYNSKHNPGVIAAEPTTFRMESRYVYL